MALFITSLLNLNLAGDERPYIVKFGNLYWIRGYNFINQLENKLVINRTENCNAEHEINRKLEQTLGYKILK